jgi:hypothetical protein
MGGARSVLDANQRRPSASPRARGVALCIVATSCVACTLDFDRFRPPFAGEIVDADTTLDAPVADASTLDVAAAHPDARLDASNEASTHQADADR